jgi:hypothetical protein
VLKIGPSSQCRGQARKYVAGHLRLPQASFGLASDMCFLSSCIWDKGNSKYEGSPQSGQAGACCSLSEAAPMAGEFVNGFRRLLVVKQLILVYNDRIMCV